MLRQPHQALNDSPEDDELDSRTSPAVDPRIWMSLLTSTTGQADNATSPQDPTPGWIRKRKLADQEVMHAQAIGGTPLTPPALRASPASSSAASSSAGPAMALEVQQGLASQRPDTPKELLQEVRFQRPDTPKELSLIHISEPTRRYAI